MAKDGAVARLPVSDAMQICERTLALFTVAVEVHRGGISVTEKHDDGSHAYIKALCTLGEKSATTNALVLDGVLYITALDASGINARERQRLLAVARRCANA